MEQLNLNVSQMRMLQQAISGALGNKPLALEVVALTDCGDYYKASYVYEDAQCKDIRGFVYFTANIESTSVTDFKRV